MASSTADEHRNRAPRRIRCAILTISDTRTLRDDRSGHTIQELLLRDDHEVVRRAVCRDEPQQIRRHVQHWVEQEDVQAILITGGTGIAGRDQTYETIRQLLTKELPGYGELFRWLSYQEIGPAAMLSRTVGGVVGSCVLLTMPGSTAAVQLAMNQLILPELGHLVQQCLK